MDTALIIACRNNMDSVVCKQGKEEIALILLNTYDSEELLLDNINKKNMMH